MKGCYEALEPAVRTYIILKYFHIVVTAVIFAQCDKRWFAMRDIGNSNVSGDLIIFPFFLIVFSFSFKKPFTER